MKLEYPLFFNNKNIGKNNKMFYIPTVFMLAATLTQLVITVISKIKLITQNFSAVVWGDWFQLCFALVMEILAIILVIEGVKTFVRQKKNA